MGFPGLGVPGGDPGGDPGPNAGLVSSTQWRISMTDRFDPGFIRADQFILSSAAQGAQRALDPRTGTATANSQREGAAYDVSNAFNGEPTGDGWSSVNAPSGAVTVDFTFIEPQAIVEVEFQFVSSSFAVGAYEIQAFTGGSWTTVFSESGLTTGDFLVGHRTVTTQPYVAQPFRLASKTHTFNNSTVEMAVAYPEGIQKDDLLVLMVMNDQSSGNVSVDPTIAGGDAGFVEVASKFGNAVMYSVWAKAANGDEEGTFNVQGAANWYWEKHAYLYRLPGAQSKAPAPPVFFDADTDGGTQLNVTSITTTVDGAIVLAPAAYDDGTGDPWTIVDVSGYGWYYEDNDTPLTSNAGCSAAVARLDQETAGPTGAVRLATSDADGKVGGVFAFYPMQGVEVEASSIGYGVNYGNDYGGSA